MRTIIKNIGAIVSGDLDQPLLTGDTILIADGRFTAVGLERDLEIGEPDGVIDAQQMTVLPGLIDPHIHLVVGDWNPRQTVFGPLEGILHGGVTTALESGVSLFAGSPEDGQGYEGPLAASRVYVPELSARWRSEGTRRVGYPGVRTWKG